MSNLVASAEPPTKSLAPAEVDEFAEGSSADLLGSYFEATNNVTDLSLQSG